MRTKVTRYGVIRADETPEVLFGSGRFSKLREHLPHALDDLRRADDDARTCIERHTAKPSTHTRAKATHAVTGLPHALVRAVIEASVVIDHDLLAIEPEAAPPPPEEVDVVGLDADGAEEAEADALLDHPRVIDPDDAPYGGTMPDPLHRHDPADFVL